MHTIEPFHLWQNYYSTSLDKESPFYGVEYSEFEYTNTIYNHYIHPQWDSIESESIYVKVLWVDYEEGDAIIEVIGEWNDALHNDIALLIDNLLDILLGQGITHFVLIGEGVLTFHFAEDDYYQDFIDNLEGGFLIGMGFQQHVREEFSEFGIDQYLVFNEEVDDLPWRRIKPMQLMQKVKEII